MDYSLRTLPPIIEMLIINHTGKYLIHQVYNPVCCFIIGENTTLRSMGKYCLTSLMIPIVFPNSLLCNFKKLHSLALPMAQTKEGGDTQGDLDEDILEMGG